ncbi:hypothetical protein B0H67DRAFT_572914 [Lasiosphaeris hirsuta]|uniref:Uncharacterized protein n=1 Tax=Lasiosphaeris hirsuta TaxID=260670 RepID=A0AA40AP40_9PEZI|nr:hypothetical protein B0H67DRAFT_572914 [Lasiosphaeris hirsuta]
MGIVESRRAIQQAEAVTKLAHLAFLFVPLTYITSIFGTNINVSPLEHVPLPPPRHTSLTHISNLGIPK